VAIIIPSFPLTIETFGNAETKSLSVLTKAGRSSNERGAQSSAPIAYSLKTPRSNNETHDAGDKNNEDILGESQPSVNGDFQTEL